MKAISASVYPPSFKRALTLLLVLLPVGGCSESGARTGSGGTQGSGGTRGSGGTQGSAGAPGVIESDGGVRPDAGSCQNVAPPEILQFPRIVVTGAKAMNVVRALTDFIGAQNPGVAVTAPYEIPSLGCVNLNGGPPVGTTHGFSCYLTVKVGATTTEIKGGPPSTQAQALFTALEEAGTAPCDDHVHSNSIDLQNLKASAGPGAGMSDQGANVQFDDLSIYDAPIQPNVRADGPAGRAVVSAFAAAGINDCDPSRRAMIVCNKFSGAVSCSYEWYLLEKVGPSYLANTCGPHDPEDGGDLGSAESLRLWQAIVVAARAGGYSPDDGTIDDITVVNARNFTWDGSQVAFFLNSGSVNVVPPPSDGDGGTQPPSMP